MERLNKPWFPVGGHHQLALDLKSKRPGNQFEASELKNRIGLFKTGSHYTSCSQPNGRIQNCPSTASKLHRVIETTSFKVPCTKANICHKGVVKLFLGRLVWCKLDIPC